MFEHFSHFQSLFTEKNAIAYYKKNKCEIILNSEELPITQENTNYDSSGKCVEFNCIHWAHSFSFHNINTQKTFYGFLLHRPRSNIMIFFSSEIQFFKKSTFCRITVSGKCIRCTENGSMDWKKCYLTNALCIENWIWFFFFCELFNFVCHSTNVELVFLWIKHFIWNDSNIYQNKIHKSFYKCRDNIFRRN